jgi:hypothetical protein
MRLSLLAFSLTLSLITPAAAASQSPITHLQFNVAGTNDEWTPTSVHAAYGDIILVLATGRVRIGQVMGEVGPVGTSSGDGALELKIGVGAAQRVGVKAFLIAVADTGEVKLRVRDSRYNDNSGSFEVSVIHIPADAIPEPGARVTTMAVPPELVGPVASMKSDLRNLVTAEEAYFADSVSYTNSLRLLGYRASPGVTVSIDRVSRDAWRGSAKHVEAPGWTCGIFVGEVPPYLPDQKEGVPRCWKGP